MTTNLEYALLAGTSYFSTRSEINHLPIPLGWNELLEFRDSDAQTGFEARTFTNGSEIVISFAGTYASSASDWAANASLASGVMTDQLLQAVRYYLQVKATGATISLTGHSLGGGRFKQTALICKQRRKRYKYNSTLGNEYAV